MIEISISVTFCIIPRWFIYQRLGHLTAMLLRCSALLHLVQVDSVFLCSLLVVGCFIPSFSNHTFTLTFETAFWRLVQWEQFFFWSESMTLVLLAFLVT